MKSYLKILETSKRDRLQRAMVIRSDKDKLSQWKALSLTEQLAGEMINRLNRVVPAGKAVSIKNVKLDFFEESGVDIDVFIKAQLYNSDHHQAILKVFVHENSGKGKTKKIARAIYNLELQNQVTEKQLV